MNSSGRILVVLVGLSVLWSGVNVCIKYADADFSPTTLAVVRWGAFALLLWALTRLRPWQDLTRLRLPTGKAAWGCFVLGALLFAPAHTLYYASVPMTTSIEATVLVSSMPMFTAFFATMILRERATALRWIAIILACAGAYVVAVGFGPPRLASEHTVGNLLFLLGLILESVGLVLIARIVLASSGIGALTWQVTGMLPAFLLAAWLLPPGLGWSVQQVSPAGLGALAYLVLVASLVCFGTWYALIERAPVSWMMVATGVQPVAGALFGWLFLGETVGPTFFAGGALIMGALALAALEKPELHDRAEIEATPAAGLE